MSGNTGNMRGGFGAMSSHTQGIGGSSMQQAQQQQQQMSGGVQTGVVAVGGSSAGGVAVSTENTQQMKQINTLSLCKVGAETVEDMVNSTSELFALLKSLQLPNGTPAGSQMSAEVKARIQENMNRTRHNFKRLHIIYDKVNVDCGGLDYTPIESLIPYRENVESRPDLTKKSDKYQHCSDEIKDLKEKLSIRASYQKAIIDQLRKIIWEINTMLALRSDSRFS